jgi:hypothetical protein
VIGQPSRGLTTDKPSTIARTARVLAELWLDQHDHWPAGDPHFGFVGSCTRHGCSLAGFCEAAQHRPAE